MTNPITVLPESEVFSEHCVAVPAGTEDNSALSRTVVATRAYPASWLAEALKVVARLLTLEPNWDSYGADVVSHDSARHAEKTLRELARIENVPSPTVTATPDGEVGFCWDAGGWSLDAWVEPAGRIVYVFIDETDHANDRDTWTDHWQDLVPLLTRW